MDTMETERFAVALGRAVIGAWGDLPQEVQHCSSGRSSPAITPSAMNPCANRWRFSYTTSIPVLQTDYSRASFLVGEGQNFCP
jgi:hypothetical protein